MPGANTVAELAVVVSADTSAAEKGLSDLGTKVGSAGSALQTAFAGAAVAGIAGVTAGLVASVSAASDFEKTMSGVSAVSGATADEMNQLSGLALQLGKDTSFSASEAGKGIEELVKGGLTIPDIMNGAAKATLDLAAAGGVSLPEAATIAANALAEFNLKGADMGHVADLIAGAANASALDVSDFSFSLKAAGAVASTIGFSFDDLAQGIAVMGKAGITGSDAGTSLKTMMLNLEPTTKKATEMMRDLGIITADGANQFFDATGKVKSMADVAQVLQTALAGQTEEQKVATLNTLFGSDAIRAAAVLTKEGAAGFNEMAASMSKVSAEAVGAEKLNNLSGSVEQLKGSLETMGITIGIQLLPILKDFVDALTAAANDAMPAMEQAAKDVAATLSDWMPTLKAVAGFLWSNRDAIAAVVAALGTFVILTTVVGWITTLVAAVTAVTAAISASGGILAALGALIALLGGPVTLIIAAVAVAVGALAYAWANDWGGIQEKTAAVVDWLAAVPDTIAGYWDAITTTTDDLVTGVTDGWAALAQATSDGWNAIATATSDAWGAISSFLVDWWREILIALTGPIGAVAVFVIDHWTQIQTATETIFRAIANVLTAIWDLIYTQIIQPKLETISAYIATTWETIRAAISEKMTAAQTFLATTWSAIATSTTETLNAYLSFVRDTIFEPLRAAVSTAITAVQTAVETAWSAISTKAHELLDPMDGAKTAFSSSLDGLKSIADSVLAPFKNAWETTWAAIEQAAASPKQALDVLRDTIQDIVNVTPKWLIPHSPTPFQVGLEGVMSAVKAMGDHWIALGSAVKGANGEIGDYIVTAARARGIDPKAALAVAEHEGGLSEYNKLGDFSGPPWYSGKSWWPFQEHYGGKGYEAWGHTAGMGNDFTRDTGWQPGDPKAWKASIDYALDYAAKHGWSAWYGRVPAGVGAWEGIPGHASGGWAGLHGPELAWLGERGPEYVVPNAALRDAGSSSSSQTVSMPIVIGGRVIEELWITGRDLAIRRGRVPGAGAASMTSVG
jgi:TP901 family phage tail tape measure protein